MQPHPGNQRTGRGPGAAGPEKRLAKKLLSLAGEKSSGPDGGKAIIGHSQQDLASMVGITRESINKHLGAWAKDGLIAVGRTEIEIVDEQGLRDIFEP